MKGRTYNASSSLVRPEFVEIKNTIRNLKKDAEMRLTVRARSPRTLARRRLPRCIAGELSCH